MSKSRQLVVCSALFIGVAALSLLAVSAFSSASLETPSSAPPSIMSWEEKAPGVKAQEAGHKRKKEDEGAINISDETNVQTRLVKKVNPVYPEEAKKQEITGKVICKSRVDENGRVVEVTVEESPHELLSQASVDAVRQWEYEPVRKDGKPVSFLISVTINFVLK